MTARPDLEAIKAVAEQFSFDSSPAGHLSDLLEEVIAYALALEQDAAGARAERAEIDAALQRWLAACDAFDDAESGSWSQHEAWMEACEAELAVKTLARALFGARIAAERVETS